MEVKPSYIVKLDHVSIKSNIYVCDKASEWNPAGTFFALMVLCVNKN